MAQYILLIVLCFSVCWSPVYGARTWETCKQDMHDCHRDCNCAYLNGHLEAISCIDAGCTDASIIREIPFDAVDTLTNITFNGNNFHELPVNFIGDCSHDGGHTMTHSYLGMEYLDLSDNNINIIHGKTFHCIQQLKVLKLNNNNLDHPENNPRMFSDLEELAELHMNNAFNFDKTATAAQVIISLAAIFENSKLEVLRELHLESNYIGSFDPRLFQKLPFLKKLYLTDNYLTNPVISMCKAEQGLQHYGCALEELYLNSNSIVRLSEEFRKSVDSMAVLKKLDLSDNPYWCDCNFLDSYKWLQRMNNDLKLVNGFRLVCNGPPALAGKEVLSLFEEDMKECVEEVSAWDEKEKKGHSSGAVAVLVIFVIAMCGLLALLYVKRRTVQEKMKPYFPRLFSASSGYNTVTNPAATV